MSLRIRRGTEAQRTGATFDLGEIVYATDTNKLYVGDGVNLGGKNILATSAGTGLVWNATTQRLDFNGSGTGIVNVQADATPSLGGNLNLNNRSINGTGITLNGSTGAITATQLAGTSLSTSALTLNTNTITSNNGVINLGTSSTASIVNIYASSSTAMNLYGASGTAFEILSANGTLAQPTTLLNNDGAGGIIFSGRNSNNGYNTVASIFAIYKGAPTNLENSNFKAQGILYFGVGNGTSTIASASFDQNGEFTAPILATTVYSAAGTVIPNAVTLGQGARAFVSDATEATFATAYTSGGSNKVPVYSDGVVWRIG